MKTQADELTLATGLTREIPATPRYGYAVCCGVSKVKTVPVPALPVLEEPRVYPYPCGTLTLGDQIHPITTWKGGSSRISWGVQEYF
jgi:hypothetical protein